VGPARLLGRIMSLIMLAALGRFPASVVVAGVLIHRLGPAIFFPIAGIVLVITVLAALTQQEIRAFGTARGQGRRGAPRGGWLSGRCASGVGDDQGGAAGLSDLAGRVPARPAHRVRPAPALHPHRLPVLPGGAHLPQGHEYLGGAAGLPVLQGAAQFPGGGRGHDDLIGPGARRLAGVIHGRARVPPAARR
jgi:hypothetical protein